MIKEQLEITTVIGCPNLCEYCPQKILIDKYLVGRNKKKLMSFDDFVGWIKTVPKNVVIDFGGFSEPLMNTDAIEMILYSFQQKYEVKLNTTLRGAGLEIVSLLSRLPFSKLSLHVPDKFGMMKYNVDDEYIEKIKIIRSNNAKIFEISEPFETFDEIKLALGNENQHLFGNSTLQTRAGHLNVNDPRWNYYGGRMSAIEPLGENAGRINCGRIMLEVKDNEIEAKTSDFILLPNGDLALCCMDYSLKHIVGNLNTQTYVEVKSGKQFNNILYKMYSTDQNDILCNKCQIAYPYSTLRK